MKKSITILLITGVAALLVVYYFLGTGYLRQSHENEALAVQITKATQTLAQTPKPPQDLAQRLAAAEASLTAAQTALPKDLNSTRVINTILELADVCQVSAIPLATSPWSIEKNDKGYHVFRINMTIGGTYSQLTSFIGHLENGNYETIVIENLDITRDAVSSNETATLTAGLDLAIYAPVTTAK